MTAKEKKISELMAKLDLTHEEAVQLMADDERIEHGEKLFELTAEQEKASRQARQTAKTPTVYQLDNTKGKRNKKEDKDKSDLLGAMFNAILPMCDTYEVANAEREFSFTYHGKKYKVVLSAPRS